ncbi:WD domain-containing protein, partial [Sporodiniella umbellata]
LTKDPWEHEYPHLIEETLEDGYVLSCKFNKRGTLLAAGCLDGRCVVWDFETKAVSRSLVGHVKPVSSISWSRNGRFLLSASKDWTCIYWDLLSGKKRLKIRFDTPVLMAHMHPKNSNRFIAVLYQDSPVIVDILGEDIVKTILPTEPETKDEKQSKQDVRHPFFVTAAAWNKAGTKVYTGTSRGYLNIIDVEGSKVIYSERITNTNIKGIQLSRNGRDLLVNANDRSIRYYQLEDGKSGIPVFRNRFQDLVNRVQWSQTCFSADGEFVIGGSGHKAEHNIYIWDKNIGNLVKILEGPKEPLDDVAWHPVKPVMGSVSSFGNIYIWANKHEENWSAFAPDFIELEENVEYEESEDEFDVMPDDEKSKQKQVGEDVLVDVTTCDSIKAFIESSDEEDEGEVYYLPTLTYDDHEDDGEDDDNKSSSSDEDYTKKSLKKHGSEILRKKKRPDSDDDTRQKKTLKK